VTLSIWTRHSHLRPFLNSMPYSALAPRLSAAVTSAQPHQPRTHLISRRGRRGDGFVGGRITSGPSRLLVALAYTLLAVIAALLLLGTHSADRTTSTRALMGSKGRLEGEKPRAREFLETGSRSRSGLEPSSSAPYHPGGALGAGSVPCGGGGGGGGGECGEALERTELGGSVVRWGKDHLKGTASECCTACAAAPSCNA